MHFSHMLFIIHVTPISGPLILSSYNRPMQSVKIMILLITLFCPVLCQFLSLRSQYSPQDLVIRHVFNVLKMLKYTLI